MDGPTVRSLLRRATTATLATLDAGTGHPYASLVEVATLPDARPILLLSGLARHTRNLRSDARASLLVDQRTAAEGPLTAERTTIIGTARPTDDANARRRYLSRYDAAQQYAGFGDFGLWVLDISHAHTIAGFGRIREVPGADVVLEQTMVDGLAKREADLVDRVNGLVEAAVTREGRGPNRCRMVALDVEGVDLAGSGGLERRPFADAENMDENQITAIICAAFIKT